ncbi:hypothetical protein GL263_15620 [Streptomyces durbertensis]|uniref:Uncharacterized protein n=1 Tax=Streptomyces durbertensis TaxID=2448886 RepID=A0ABR6EI48_9ACTN|nr:hypothetical protein [Streptomyces durbertensis]MBB1244985.1 hypothetical protein [Streptomyces durbertensis]
MGFEDEWAELKSAAQNRTRLNAWDEGPGTGRGEAPRFGDLKVSTAALRGLAKQSGTLANHAQSAVTDLTSSHAGLPGSTRGFTSTATLETVRSSWEGRLGDARKEALRLQRVFDATAGEFDGTEQRTKADMSNLADGNGKPKSAIAGLS